MLFAAVPNAVESAPLPTELAACNTFRVAEEFGEGKNSVNSRQHHDEVLSSLRNHQDLARGAAVQKDRNSALDYLGVPTPVVRKIVRAGFSFYTDSDREILATWDRLWESTPYGEVMFAALEYYRARISKGLSPTLWPTLKRWIGRVDNWAHCDDLCRLYSHLLEGDPERVTPALDRWNRSRKLWKRRASLVSRIHYSGKNAIFLPPEAMLPAIENCLEDHRHYVQTAVGWVLREMSVRYPQETTRFVDNHVGRFGSEAFRRAIDKLPARTKEKLRARRRTATSN